MFAFVQRRVARGAVERDAGFDAVEDECVALNPGDADVGPGVDVEIDCTPIAQFAVDDIAHPLPAALKVEEALLLVNEAVDGAVGLQRRYRSSFLLQRVKVKIALGQDPSEDIEEGIAATQNVGLLKQFAMFQQ